MATYDIRGLPSQIEVTPPVAVATAALNRAKAAARARGFRPSSVAQRDDAVSGAVRTRRDPQLLGEALGTLLTERGWTADVAVGNVVARWAEIVGTEIAEHSTAEQFVDGVLFVRAHSSAWATQLRFLAANILAAIARDVGEGVVQELRVVTPDARTGSKGRLRVQGGRPRR